MAELQNIDLSVFRKKQFTIDGDENRILELDTSDLNIIKRIKEFYPKLQKLEEKLQNIPDFKDDQFVDIADFLDDIDSEMRTAVDAIFDSNVCEVCVPNGSMYDPINGRLRYEILIDVLSKLYDENLSAEIKKVNKRVEKHTAKYVKKGK
jgi:hypothetical protein